MNRWRPPKQTTVLVVSEDADTRSAILVALRSAPSRVVEATDTHEGMEAFNRSQPDIVLLDASGANRQRLDLCKLLRTQEEARHVPIVLLVNAEDFEVALLGHKVGATDLLEMPISGELLKLRLKYILAAADTCQRLAHAVDRMEQAQRFARIGTWEWSLRSRTLEFSEEAQRILGLSSQGSNVTVDSLLRNVPLADRPRLRTWLDEASHGGHESTIEHRIAMPDGAERVVRQRAAISRDTQGTPSRVSVVISDITEWRKAEAQNRYQTSHDMVTGLENLERFLQRLDEATWVAQRAGSQFAVFCLGVARFGRIHESLGQRFGDAVLKGIADRLHNGLRKTDWYCNITEEGRTPQLARLDGAEFAILLQPIARIDEMARVAARINQTFSEPIVWGGQELFLSTHIGIAIYPGDAESPEELLQRAQTAMRRAQTEGKSEPYFATAEMTHDAAERLALEASLRHALERDELEIFYQPKVDIASGRIAGMEALLRWQHPQLGRVAPDGFVPLAEETGVIVPIGEWVLRTACLQAKQWQDAGHPPFPLAVNVSVEQFRRSNVAETVARVLEETGLPAQYLEVELTESGLMDHSEENLIILRALKDLGILLAVDDFGTGYSSLSYLRQLPIDILKIDRSFITDLSRDLDADAIVTTIVSMARSLELKVIAEGVETEEQLAFLRKLGCDEYQGYLFSRPRPAGSATDLLQEERLRTGAA